GRVRALRSWLSLIPSFSLAALTWAFSSLLRYIRACGKLICFASQATIANNIIAQHLNTVNELPPPRLPHTARRRGCGVAGIGSRRALSALQVHGVLHDIPPPLQLRDQRLVADSSQGVALRPGLAVDNGGDIIPYRQGPGAFARFPFILQRDLQAIWRNPVELNDRIPVLHAAWLVVSQHEGADGQLGLLPPAEPVTDKGVTVGLSGVYGLQNLGPALL